MFTIGKRGEEADILAGEADLRAQGVTVHRIPRGGQTTFHGPGQLVAYPLLALRSTGLGARAYVEALEDAMVATAGSLGVSAKVAVTALCITQHGEGC